MCLCFGFCAFFWSWCVNLGRVATVPSEWLAAWWWAQGACAPEGKLCPSAGTGMLRPRSPASPGHRAACASACAHMHVGVLNGGEGEGRGQRWGHGEAETGGLCDGWAECCSHSPAKLWHRGAATKCSSVEANGAHPVLGHSHPSLWHQGDREGLVDSRGLGSGVGPCGGDSPSWHCRQGDGHPPGS